MGARTGDASRRPLQGDLHHQVRFPWAGVRGRGLHAALPGIFPSSVHCLWSRSGSAWAPVPGCERVQNPLVCKLTETFSEQDKVYFIKVTALLGDQVLGSEEKSFHPIRDSKWTSWSPWDP